MNIKFRYGYLLACVCAITIWSLIDRPTAADHALASAVADYCARELRDVPELTDEALPAGGKAYAFRPGTNGLVILIYYGVTSTQDMLRVRAVAVHSFAPFPALKTLSIEYYEAIPFTRAPDGSLSRTRERMVHRETVDRPG